MLFVFDSGRIVRVKEYHDTLHAHQTFSQPDNDEIGSEVV